jgi:hypothetical protein
MEVLDVVMLQHKCLQVRAASGEHRDSGCVSEYKGTAATSMSVLIFSKIHSITCFAKLRRSTGSASPYRALQRRSTLQKKIMMVDLSQEPRQ